MTVVLAVLLVLVLVAAGTLAVQLRRTRAELASLQHQLETERRTHAQHPAVQAAGRAVQVVARTAARVREHGMVSGLLVGSIEDFTRWALEDRSEIARYSAPDGTVTVFFSDIEDSTASNERLGDRGWVRLLAAHDRLVRAAVERHHGHVVKSQGDGFMVVFAEPAEAVHAGLDIQRALAGSRSRRLRRTPVRVRIGIHTGPAIEKGGDFFGRNVAKAARVAACADGGEILVSDEVRGHLEDLGIILESRGETSLKGLDGSHLLWVATAA